MKNFYLCTSLSGYGVIGSRARLRIWCRETWGFESLHAHHLKAFGTEALGIITKSQPSSVPSAIMPNKLYLCPQ